MTSDPRGNSTVPGNNSEAASPDSSQPELCSVVTKSAAGPWTHSGKRQRTSSASLASQHNKLRVFIVDDQPLLVDGLRRLILSQPDLTCCGEASSREAALTSIPTLQPDLVIIEPWLRGHDGMEVLRELLVRHAGLRILVLSQQEEEAYAERVLRAGALGFVMKAQPNEDLLAAIRTTIRGQSYIGSQLVSSILNRVLHGPGDEDLGSKLTQRERQIFHLLGRGLDTRTVAAQLQLSAKTVATHRENIKHKLALPDAPSLVRAAQHWVHSNGR